MGGLAGYYEYCYCFWADDDSTIPAASAVQGIKTYLFDIRTSFKLRGNDGQMTDLGWERFGSDFKKWGDAESGVFHLEEKTRHRLKLDYGMSDEELRSWADAALAFAKQTDADSSSEQKRVVVGLLDVLTVQQEGEPMEAARERAIKTESLIPSYVLLGFPRGKGIMSNNMEKEEKLFYAKRHKWLLRYDLPRIRVVEGDEAAAAAICAVCSRNSPKGTQISPLPTCDHFVHPRCLYNWLRDLNHCCPLCSAPIPTDDDIYKQDDFIEQLRKEQDDYFEQL